MYICGERKFKTLRAAIAFFKKEFVRTGMMLSIEPVVVLNKEPGYVAYLARGMKL